MGNDQSERRPDFLLCVVPPRAGEKIYPATQRLDVVAAFLKSYVVDGSGRY